MCLVKDHDPESLKPNVKMLESKYNVILILELPFLKFLDCLQILSLATAQRSAQTTSNNVKRIWNGNLKYVIDRKYHVTSEYQLYVTSNEERWLITISIYILCRHQQIPSSFSQHKLSNEDIMENLDFHWHLIFNPIWSASLNLARLNYGSDLLAAFDWIWSNVLY